MSDTFADFLESNAKSKLSCLIADRTAGKPVSDSAISSAQSEIYHAQRIRESSAREEAEKTNRQNSFDLQRISQQATFDAIVEERAAQREAAEQQKAEFENKIAEEQEQQRKNDLYLAEQEEIAEKLEEEEIENKNNETYVEFFGDFNHRFLNALPDLLPAIYEGAEILNDSENHRGSITSFNALECTENDLRILGLRVLLQNEYDEIYATIWRRVLCFLNVNSKIKIPETDALGKLIQKSFRSWKLDDDVDKIIQPNVFVYLSAYDNKHGTDFTNVAKTLFFEFAQSCAGWGGDADPYIKYIRSYKKFLWPSH